MGDGDSKFLCICGPDETGSERRVKVEIPVSSTMGVSSNLTAGKVWPASVVLSHFLLYFGPHLDGKAIFEFGSGMAIPSMVALKGGHISSIYLQELDIPSLLQMQVKLFRFNNLSTMAPTFNQVSLKWGAMPKDFCPDPPISLFIAADCLYERNDFSDLVATAAFLMKRSQGAHWIMCYQDRNILYSIDELFEFWGLKSSLIPFESFKFEPTLFLAHNNHASTGLVDDFPPASDCHEVLYLLEICQQDQPFLFASNLISEQR